MPRITASGKYVVMLVGAPILSLVFVLIVNVGLGMSVNWTMGLFFPVVIVVAGAWAYWVLG